eukprot:TRINITY_DN3782_c0_g1_i2.p1 TRINITY_DN3782_c0_g1~~TRINITY_DN3782_c0_g1_i2.p1  ORF type:complete len:669 (+),score=121.79 TRINITY_DN3782_c0_g1_i2:90-2096(+)
MPEALVTTQPNKTRISLVSDPESAPTEPNALAWAEAKKVTNGGTTISLRNSILLLTFFSVLSVALVSVVPSYTFGFSAVGNISDQLQDQTMDRIKNQLQMTLDIPHDVMRAFNSTVFGWKIETFSNHCNHYAARRLYFGGLNGTKYISKVYYGSMDVGFVGIWMDRGIPSLGCSDQTTNYSLSFFFPVNNSLLDTPTSQMRLNNFFPNFPTPIRPWFLAAVKANAPTWGPVYSSLSPHGVQLAVTAVRPIYDYRNQTKIVGVSGAETYLYVIQEMLDAIKTSENGYAYILQKDTKVIANTLGAPFVDAKGKHYTYLETKNSLMIKSANKLKKDAKGHIIAIPEIRSYTFMQGDTQYFALASTLIDPRGGIEWTVVVLIPRGDIFGKIDSMIILSSVLTAVLFVATLAITLLVSTYISRPLNVVADAMQNISRLEFEKRTSKDSESRLKEIRIIQSSFQVMDTALQSFGKFVPMAVVKRIVADSDNQGQLYLERRNVTIMFADIEGFTTLSEMLPSEDLVEILNDYLQSGCGLVMSTGGTIADFIGDAVVALWNAPTNVDDHAMCACVCAVKYLRGMDQLNRKWLAKKLITKPMKVRIGIHTGPVISGNIGSVDRMKYDAIGDSMNLAARLESLNKRYGSSIIISDDTKSAVAQRMIVRPFEYVIVKGR